MAHTPFLSDCLWLMTVVDTRGPGDPCIGLYTDSSGDGNGIGSASVRVHGRERGCAPMSGTADTVRACSAKARVLGVGGLEALTGIGELALAERFEQAWERIKRDIIFAASLYL